MNTTRVVNINKLSFEEKRALQAGDPQYIYIGRAHTLYAGQLTLKKSKWASIHDTAIKDICKQRKCGIAAAMQIAADQYRDELMGNPKLLAALPELCGKTLVCFCKPLPCHGDVLVDLIESMESEP